MKSKPALSPLDTPSLPRLGRRGIYTTVKPFSGLAMLAVAVVVVTALYFAKNVFVPLALAILMSFAL